MDFYIFVYNIVLFRLDTKIENYSVLFTLDMHCDNRLIWCTVNPGVVWHMGISTSTCDCTLLFMVMSMNRCKMVKNKHQKTSYILFARAVNLLLLTVCRIFFVDISTCLIHDLLCSVTEKTVLLVSYDTGVYGITVCIF